MDRIMLTDPGIQPSRELLAGILRDSFSVYEEMIASVTGSVYGLEPQWRWYNDGKAWLCKMVFKKKTIFWLSVWDGFYKAGFYFVERHLQGINELDIASDVKEALAIVKPFGTMYPVTLEIRRKEQITDLLRLIEYKKKLK